MRELAKAVIRRLVRRAVTDQTADLRTELADLRAEVARQAAELGQVRDWLARLPAPLATASPPLGSAVCRAEHWGRPDFRRWVELIKERPHPHRKQWEYCYIAQALAEAGLLGPGRRGLGFAVGREPLAALFAAHGCEVVATDLDPADPSAAGWSAAAQHAAPGADLNDRGICPPADFASLVTFRPADMTVPPADLRGFDFVWSSCAVEHVGSLEKARQAVVDMMACLRPGGLAVHTTEFNLSSDTDTLEAGGEVIWRRRDLHALAAELRAVGHIVAPFDLDREPSFANAYVDDPPYRQAVHLNLRLGGFASTSVGLVIRAAG